MKESPIFVKTYDMLVWLLKHTRNFPRDQRFVMAKRMEEAGLGLYDELLLACQPGARRRALVAADHPPRRCHPPATEKEERGFPRG